MEAYYIVIDNMNFVLVTLITAYCYAFFVKSFLKKKRYAGLIAITYGAMMMFLYFVPVQMGNFVAYAIGALAGFLVMTLIDQRNIRQKVFLMLSFFSVRWISLAMVNCIDKMVTQYIQKIPNFQFNDSLQIKVFAGQKVLNVVLCFVFLFGAIYLIQSTYLYKKEDMTGREFALLLIPSLSGIFGYAILQYYNTSYERDTGKSLYDIYWGYNILCFLQYTVALFTIVILTVLFQNIKGKREEEKRNDILLGQIENMKQHISEVEKLYKDMRSLKHDMGNHIMTIEKLFNKREYQEAQEYMKMMNQQYISIAQEIKSGNPVTDVILEEKSKEAQENGIEFKNTFFYPQHTNLNAFDVGVILNNILTNAIDGAIDCTNPCIEIRSYQKHNAYMIEIKNTYSGIRLVDDESGLPLTTKTDEGHGFGLINVRRVAQKYYGDIDIEQTKEYFILSIMLMVK